MMLELKIDQRTVAPGEIEQRRRDKRTEKLDEMCKLQGWQPRLLGRVPMAEIVSALRAMKVGDISEKDLTEWVREYVESH